MLLRPIGNPERVLIAPRSPKRPRFGIAVVASRYKQGFEWTRTRINFKRGRLKER